MGCGSLLKRECPEGKVCFSSQDGGSNVVQCPEPMKKFISHKVGGFFHWLLVWLVDLKGARNPATVG